MNLKRIKKKLAVSLLVGVIGMGMLTGCGENKKLIFTTGLSGNELFKIGSSKGTIPEAMIYLTSFYNQYVKNYGEEMWNYDFGGISLEEHVKGVVINKMAQIKTMNLMAEEYDISLEKEEEARVNAAVDAYYAQLSETLKKDEKITKKVVEKVFTEYAIANKVYASITEAADMEISDDEARTVAVQYIYFPNWKLTDGVKTSLNETEILEVEKKAEEVWRRIQEGENFETVAADQSADGQYVKNIARGTVEAALEEIVFSLDEGESSGIVQTTEGLYIVKCISTMDYEGTQANKLVLAEERRKKAFSEAYAEVADNNYVQYREKLWDSLTMKEELHCTDVNFFEIYEEYVKQ